MEDQYLFSIGNAIFETCLLYCADIRMVVFSAYFQFNAFLTSFRNCGLLRLNIPGFLLTCSTTQAPPIVPWTRYDTWVWNAFISYLILPNIVTGLCLFISLRRRLFVFFLSFLLPWCHYYVILTFQLTKAQVTTAMDETIFLLSVMTACTKKYGEPWEDSIRHDFKFLASWLQFWMVNCLGALSPRPLSISWWQCASLQIRQRSRLR
jgi:hypothetical protein